MEQAPRMAGWEQKLDTTFGFFRDKVEGSKSTYTDEDWENGVTKTDEYKVQDSDGGEPSDGALDSSVFVTPLSRSSSV